MKSIKLSHPSSDGKSCAPLALSVILNQPYELVNDWLVTRKYRHSRVLKNGIRKAKGGTFTDRIDMNKEFGLIDITSSEYRGLSVNRFIEKVRSFNGTYLIRVPHHVLAVKGDIAYDTGYSEKRRVKQVWRLDILGKLPRDFPTQSVSEVIVKKQSQSIKKPKGEKFKIMFEFLKKCEGLCTIKDLMLLSGASYVYCRHNLIQYRNMRVRQQATTSL